MTASVSSLSVAHQAANANAPKPVGLTAELSKSESELADWVYCASAKTPEGKHKIEQLTRHIDLIKARIDSAEQSADGVTAKGKVPSHPADPTSGAGPLALANALAIAGGSGQVVAGSVQSPSPGQNRYSTTGAFVDQKA